MLLKFLILENVITGIIQWNNVILIHQHLLFDKGLGGGGKENNSCGFSFMDLGSFSI